MHCSSPARIAWAASITALSPDPHTLLMVSAGTVPGRPAWIAACRPGDRKSTRLNSSHLVISYAVFCLKKKKTEQRVGRIIHPYQLTLVIESAIRVPQRWSVCLHDD